MESRQTSANMPGLRKTRCRSGTRYRDSNTSRRPTPPWRRRPTSSAHGAVARKSRSLSRPRGSGSNSSRIPTPRPAPPAVDVRIAPYGSGLCEQEKLADSKFLKTKMDACWAGYSDTEWQSFLECKNKMITSLTGDGKELWAFRVKRCLEECSNLGSSDNKKQLYYSL